MRAHAHVEDHIRRLKDSVLCRFPFTSLDANRAWLAAVCIAGDRVRWFQLLCLRGHFARAEPNTLRWRLWHAPARVIRHAGRDIVRTLDGWPAVLAILPAHAHIAALVRLRPGPDTPVSHDFGAPRHGSGPPSTAVRAFMK
jgi:hypothetical protein